MYLMNTKSPVVGPGGRPVRWNSLHANEAEFLIRTWAVDSRKVFVSRHAYDRQMERSAVTRVDVMDIRDAAVLSNCYIQGEGQRPLVGFVAGVGFDVDREGHVEIVEYEYKHEHRTTRVPSRRFRFDCRRGPRG